MRKSETPTQSKPEHLTADQFAAIDKATAKLESAMDLFSKTGDTAKLTDKQRSRALATLSGESAATIATRENVSKQAIVKTLAAPAVRRSLSELLEAAEIRKNGKTMSMLAFALETMTRALQAEKPFGFGGNFKMVPDYVTRLAAAQSIVALHQGVSALPGGPVPAADDVATSVQETVSLTRTRRRA